MKAAGGEVTVDELMGAVAEDGPSGLDIEATLAAFSAEMERREKAEAVEWAESNLPEDPKELSILIARRLERIKRTL